uniref:TetR/AcrR family transcriptional regulator n=1 Tax=Sphingomonas sp. GlSt437 TaxID=3389970 RepID=UPI003A8B65B2
MSSIYYHFDDLERLLIASQQRALEHAKQWCSRQLQSMPTPVDDDDARKVMSPLMAALIQDWSVNHRALAFAWRECQLVAARNRKFAPALEGWNSLWADFWQRVSERYGMPDYARLNYYLFDGEGFLHLIQGDAVADAACLVELCQGWGDWLAGRPAAEGPWRRHARLNAAKTAATVIPEGAIPERIAHAAADLVARNGPGGLTHRAVAAEAGLTLGAVSYHCRTSADLMHLAYETVYWRTMGQDLAPVPGISGKEYEDLREATLGAEETPEMALSRLAMNELILAVARDSALKGLAANLRYFRGRKSRTYLAVILGSTENISALEAAMLSDLAFARSRGYFGMNAADRMAARERDLDEIDAFLLSTRGRSRLAC